MRGKESLSFSHRKHIPHDFDNNGITHNPSERPSASREPLDKMGFKIVLNGHPLITNPELFQLQPTNVAHFGTRKPAVRLIPLVRRPLTPVFKPLLVAAESMVEERAKTHLEEQKDRIIN